MGTNHEGRPHSPFPIPDSQLLQSARFRLSKLPEPLDGCALPSGSTFNEPVLLDALLEVLLEVEP